VTLAESLRPALTQARSIAGTLGLRPHAVELVTVSSSGSHVGDGTVTRDATPITEANGQPPKVRWLSNEEIAVGQLPSGSIEIGPITHAFAFGGTDIASLDGSQLQAMQGRQLRITGPQHPHGARYEITNVNAESALHITLQAKPIAESP